MEIFNFISNILIVVFIVYTHYLYRLELEILRTLKKNKPIGLTLWWRSKNTMSGRGIISFYWINPDKAREGERK